MIKQYGMADLMIALVWLGFFAAVFLGWYFYLKARNKERMALIERGKDVSEIYAKREIKFKFPWLKIGLLITGIGFGIAIFISLVAFVPAFKEIKSLLLPFIFTANMMLFGGIGLIIGYYLDKPKK